MQLGNYLNNTASVDNSSLLQNKLEEKFGVSNEAQPFAPSLGNRETNIPGTQLVSLADAQPSRFGPNSFMWAKF